MKSKNWIPFFKRMTDIDKDYNLNEVVINEWELTPISVFYIIR